MQRVKKFWSNGSVVSTKHHLEQDNVFVSRRTPDGKTISSMNRSVYDSALANAKAALRKKALVNH